VAGDRRRPARLVRAPRRQRRRRDSRRRRHRLAMGAAHRRLSADGDHRREESRGMRRHPVAWFTAAAAVALAAMLLGLVTGPASIRPWGAVLTVVDHVPGVHVRTGLSHQQSVIIWELRLPRVILGLLVGAMLALAGASYQGVFRNPLADPYLLGVAAGAGFGATVAIVSGLADHGVFSPVT